MDNKGQTMGIILMAFLGVIVGLVLFQASAGQVGRTHIQVVLVNGTYTSGANGASVDLIGQELLSTPYVINQSAPVNVGGNFTIYEGVSPTTGVKTIRMKTINETWASKGINVSYTYGADGYIEDSGTTAIAGLVVIFAALAVAMVVLVPTLRSGVLDLMKG